MKNSAFAMKSDISRPLSTFPRSSLKKSGYCLLMASLLTGCWAQAIKAPSAQLDKLQSVLVVAVEAPPLEIIPDPVERRIPAYGHYRNMAMPVDLDSALYRNSAGIVIAGLVDRDELQNIGVIKHNSPAAIESNSSWTPTNAVAEIAQDILSLHWIHSALKRNYRPLPLAEAERNAELSHWHRAIQDWYAQENITAYYAGLSNYDAVLEVGVANRIFEGQLSLEVLLKLINPHTGKIMARTRAEAFEVDAQALNSLETNSEAFKQRITDMGELLLSQAFEQIGWRLNDLTFPIAKR